MPASRALLPTATALAVLMLLSGCKKSACKRGTFVPVTFPWDKHPDLVPPGSEVCGVDEPGHSSLWLSFAKDDNPFVTTIQHLESKGWKRVSQDTKSLDSLTAQLERGTEQLEVWVQRESGYENAVKLKITDKDCARHKAKDGTSCRDGKPDKVIRCEHSNWVADGPACEIGELCLTNAGPGKGGQGETAKCYPPGGGRTDEERAERRERAREHLEKRRLGDAGARP